MGKTEGFDPTLLTTVTLAAELGTSRSTCRRLLIEGEYEPANYFYAWGWQKSPQWSPELIEIIRQTPSFIESIEKREGQLKGHQRRLKARYKYLDERYKTFDSQKALLKLGKTLIDIRGFINHPNCKKRIRKQLKTIYSQCVRRLYDLGYSLGASLWGDNKFGIHYYGFNFFLGGEAFLLHLPTHKANFIVDINQPPVFIEPEKIPLDMGRWKRFNRTAHALWFLNRSYELVKHLPKGI